MKKILFAFVFIVCAFQAISQETFLKRLNLGEFRSAWQIVSYEGRIFILVAGVCDSQFECSLFIEVTDEGEVLWERELRWLDVASKSMVIENDTIFISGNHPSSDRWLWHQMSVDGGDSLATYEVYEQGRPFSRMFNLGQVKYGNNYCIYGPGNSNDEESSLLYFINSKGQLDTLVQIFTTGIDADPWEVIPDGEGNLVAFIRYREEGKNRQRVVAKINENKELFWTYFSEENSMQDAVPNGAILDDGTIVYNSREQFNRAEKLRGIGQDSTIIWSHDPTNTNGESRDFSKIQIMKDGSILGVGRFFNRNVDPSIWDVPWITKVSDTGEQEWERAYYAFRVNNIDTQIGYFSDAVELTDGSIMAIGNITPVAGQPREILIARLDSEGCLSPDCGVYNDVTDLLSSVESWSPINFDIYPNPVRDILHIEGGIKDSQTYSIKSISGQTIQSGQLSANGTVEVGNLPSGLYIMELQEPSGKRSVSKFVKQ